MITYHKIQSLFKRDPANKHKTFLMDEYSLPEFEYLKDFEWCGTEKVDGTNVRVGWENGKLAIGGRSDNAQMPLDLVAAIQDMFDTDSAKAYFDKYPEAVLFGEGYGPGIQKVGKLYREEGKSFVLFDAWTGDRWLAAGYVEDVAHELGIDDSPNLFTGTLDEAVEMVSQQGGFSSTWNENLVSEGLVIRPRTELCTACGARIITKLKCKDFPD
jgi:hypothetical protein